jgi:hypothetical protein
MAITLNGSTGIATSGGYTGDGIVLADSTPSNTLVTTTGGNVGVGTATPTEKLDVNGAIAVAGKKFFSKITSDSYIWNNTSALNFVDSTGSAVQMKLDSSGNLSVGLTGTGGRLSVKGAASSQVGYFETSTAGFGFRLLTNGSDVGSIIMGASSTSFNTSSDYRLKENVAPMTGGLATVAALKPCTYTWKSTGEAGQGFIAHELQAVVPDCVTGEKDAVETVDDLDAEGRKIGTKEVPRYQGVDTSFLVATLVSAIQEQQALITQLQADVAALKGATP